MLRRFSLVVLLGLTLSLAASSLAAALSGKASGYRLSFGRGSLTLDLPRAAGEAHSFIIACGPRGSERTLTVLTPNSSTEKVLKASSPRPTKTKRCVVLQGQKQVAVIHLH